MTSCKEGGRGHYDKGDMGSVFIDINIYDILTASIIQYFIHLNYTSNHLLLSKGQKTC